MCKREIIMGYGVTLSVLLCMGYQKFTDSSQLNNPFFNHPSDNAMIVSSFVKNGGGAKKAIAKTDRNIPQRFKRVTPTFTGLGANGTLQQISGRLFGTPRTPGHRGQPQKLTSGSRFC